jgi:hypothetical protein
MNKNWCNAHDAAQCLGHAWTSFSDQGCKVTVFIFKKLLRTSVFDNCGNKPTHHYSTESAMILFQECPGFQVLIIGNIFTYSTFQNNHCIAINNCVQPMGNDKESARSKHFSNCCLNQCIRLMVDQIKKQSNNKKREQLVIKINSATFLIQTHLNVN